MKPSKIHFEDLWEEAEKLSTYTEISKSQIIDLLNSIEQHPECFGDILFLLAKLSKSLNINVAAALQNKINDVKIDLYEE